MALPSVAAQVDPTRIADATSRVWTFIGAAFNFDSVPAEYHLGIIKFFTFILILTLVRWSLLRVGKDGRHHLFDNKTAGILATVIAAITVFATPNAIIINTLLIGLVPLLIVLGGIYVGCGVLKGSLGRNLVGLFVILLTWAFHTFNWWLIQNYSFLEASGITEGLLVILAYLDYALAAALIYKIGQLVFSGVSSARKSAKPWKWPWKSRKEEKPPEAKPTPEPEALAAPSAPENVRHTVYRDDPTQPLVLSWDPPAPEERIIGYEIERRNITPRRSADD
ncbi:MAG: fibronectin type III domain-containing protein [Nitrosarchaeum sp.]|nr:fibronectin type III domain-containing protein [Nitrosarchaeum sp.]